MKTHWGKHLIKSDRAIAAEGSGRFPASAIAAELGVPTTFISECAPGRGEWHHVSKYANEVRYYELEEIRTWLRSNDGQAERQRWKEQKRTRKTVIYQNATVEWIEWSGSFKHPKARACSAASCDVVDRGGQFVEVKPPNGTIFKKKKTCNGFSVVVGGKVVKF